MFVLLVEQMLALQLDLLPVFVMLVLRRTGLHVRHVLQVHSRVYQEMVHVQTVVLINGREARQRVAMNVVQVILALLDRHLVHVQLGTPPLATLVSLAHLDHSRM